MGPSKASLASSLLLLGQASAALPPIIMKGTKFFYDNGTQFFMKGIAYQQDSAAAGAAMDSHYKDPLADAESCKRDVPLLKALRTNTIRTYAIDPTADHDACMKLLGDAGIYVISDLSEPVLSINRDEPKWDVDLYKRYTSVIDALSKYDNVIGFFAGNEVTNNNTNTEASAYVKAAVRDTKAYIKDNVKRWMGVGYASNDDEQTRINLAHYFNCGDQDSAIDYWGYNIYEWCGKSSFEESGYSKQVDFFKNYSVPVFFAEYGCQNPGGAEKRIWQETESLYSDDMTGVFSGGIVYMYFEEQNDFGLVKVDGDTASTMKNYDTLKTKMASIDPSSTSMDDYKPTNSPAACPNVQPGWQVKGEVLPPKPDSNLCDCMYRTLSCVPERNLNETAYGSIFGTICGDVPEACVGINGNTSTGVYGAFAMCDSKQKLGFVLDAYYKNQKQQSHACDFEGQAVVTRAASVDDKCKESLASASSANDAAATATSAGESSSSFARPMPMNSHMFTLGDVAIGFYVLVAMGVGAGMVLL